MVGAASAIFLDVPKGNIRGLAASIKHRRVMTRDAASGRDVGSNKTASDTSGVPKAAYQVNGYSVHTNKTFVASGPTYEAITDDEQQRSPRPTPEDMVVSQMASLSIPKGPHSDGSSCPRTCTPIMSRTTKTRASDWNEDSMTNTPQVIPPEVLSSIGYEQLTLMKQENLDPPPHFA